MSVCFFLLGLILIAAPTVSFGQNNPVVPDAYFGPFKHGTYPSLAGKTHMGIDLVQPDCGSPIYAFADGKVVDHVYLPNDRALNKTKGIGYMVIIEHPAELTDRIFHTMYLHMQGPPLVGLNEPVTGGKTILGYVGNTGNTGAKRVCHTHFEIRYFSERYFEEWGGIYGSGDRRRSRAFKTEWEDPVVMFRQYPNGITLQSETPPFKLPDIPGSSFFQSFVDDINPSALAAQIAPLLNALGIALVALSGLVLILQAKKLAGSMLATGIGCVVVGAAPGLMVPLFVFIKSLPIWIILIMAVFISLSMLGAFASIFIGKAAAASMVGNLAAWVIRRIILLLILPFTALRRLFSRDDL